MFFSESFGNGKEARGGEGEPLRGIKIGEKLVGYVFVDGVVFEYRNEVRTRKDH